MNMHFSILCLAFCCVTLVLSDETVNFRGRNQAKNDDSINDTSLFPFTGRNLQVQKYFSKADLGEINYTASMGNPLKGLANGINEDLGSPVSHSMEFSYVQLYNVLVGPETYDWQDFENRLAATARRNKHLIPRFYIHWVPHYPGLPKFLNDTVEMRQHKDYGGGWSPYYGDPFLLSAIEKFIAAFGAKYDGDRRIGFIQMGLLGYFGEWHTLNNPFIPEEVKVKVTNWYAAAFKTTPVMARYPSKTAYDSHMGYHDDSFTWYTLDGTANGGETKSWFFWPIVSGIGQQDFWKRGPMGGEVRPENVPIVMNNDYPAGTKNKQDFMLCVNTTHTSYMKLSFFQSESAIDNGNYAHSRMGYNFIVKEVSASTTNTSNLVDIDVTIQQIGIAPFYYPLSVVVNCRGLPFPMNVSGAEQIYDQYETKKFVFTGIPATTECLSSISISLDSPRILFAARPVKFAQGSDGSAIKVSIPLPPFDNGIPSPPTGAQNPTTPGTGTYTNNGAFTSTQLRRKPWGEFLVFLKSVLSGRE